MALVLIAVAGTVVATAAAAGLRATHQAATLGRAAALAGRELSAIASRAATASTSATTLTVPGFPGTVQRTTTVERAGTVVTLSVRIDAGRPPVQVGLATRVLVEE